MASTPKTLRAQPGRLARQQRGRNEPGAIRQAPWIQARLHAHMLTRRELASLLSLSLHTVSSWLMHPSSRHWMPLTTQRARQIETLLPPSVPMQPHASALLKWSPLRCAAYHDYFGQDIPQIHGQQLKQWRQERCISQRGLAALLDIDPATILRWESGKTFPTLQQRNIWWLMHQPEFPLEPARG